MGSGICKTSKIYYGYWLVVAAFMAQFISIGVYSYVLGPFMTPMIEELGWSRSEFTLTRTISQLVMAAVGVFVGARVDRYGGKPIMLVGITILAVSLALHSLVDSLLSWWVLNGSWLPLAVPWSATWWST